MDERPQTALFRLCPEPEDSTTGGNIPWPAHFKFHLHAHLAEQGKHDLLQVIKRRCEVLEDAAS